MDLHVHSAFKPFFTSAKLQNRKNAWQPLYRPIPVLGSQASLLQLVKGNVNLAVVAIVPIELGFASNLVIRGSALINKLITQATGAGTILDNQLVTDVSTGRLFFYDIYEDELKTLEANQEFEGHSFQFINAMEEFDPEKLNIIMAIEGAHVLSSTAPSLQLLDKLKNGKHRILYLTFVHLTRYRFCTFAYGMKLLKGRVFHPVGFGINPWGQEILERAYSTQHGRRILIDIKHMSLVSRQQFYKWRKENGFDNIPIVASHMGVAGYAHANMHEYITGKVVEDGTTAIVTWQKPKGLGNTTFNPWTINLLDDDIEAIIQSKGLIGMNLDKRILGVDAVAPEYFSLQELTFLLKGQEPLFKKVNKLEETATTDELTELEAYLANEDVLEQVHTFSGEEEEALEQELLNSIEATIAELEALDNTEEATLANERQSIINKVLKKLMGIVEEGLKKIIKSALVPRPLEINQLANNILHIVKVGGKDAWQHICLGSDFDGLVDPIVLGILSTKEYRYIEPMLVTAMVALSFPNYRQYHINPLKPVKDVRAKVRNIMYNNGIRFLEQHYTNAGNVVVNPSA